MIDRPREWHEMYELGLRCPRCRWFKAKMRLGETKRCPECGQTCRQVVTTWSEAAGEYVYRPIRAKWPAPPPDERPAGEK